MIKKITLSFFLFAITMLLLSAPAAAAGTCGNPAGNEGDMLFNEEQSVMQFCNGAIWVGFPKGYVSSTNTDPCDPINSPAPGEACDDGTVYAGVAGDGDAMYTTTGNSSGLIPWNNGNSSNITNTTATDWNEGWTNTAILQAGGASQDSDSGTGGVQPHQAAQVCADLTTGGHTDWYLPAGLELNTLLINAVSIGGFNEPSWQWYWSSTQEFGTGARVRSQDNASAGSRDKFDTAITRCVRKGYVNLNADSCNPDLSPAVGTVCADGSVYAGLSPDRNIPMFTERCATGRTWNGASCTGTETAVPWNNGNNTGYTSIAGLSYTAGEANTAILVAEDADSGVAGIQPHRAAHFCNDLVNHGHDDWYLPSANELLAMQPNRAAIGGFTNDSGWFGYYFSSRQHDVDDMYGINMTSGSNGSNLKHNSWKVRCVRKGYNPPCVNPAGAPGDIIYNDDDDVVQWCGGGEWYEATGAVGDCTGPSDCRNPGDMCGDGTVFAGCTPSTYKQLFTTKCGGGRSWNGSACAGTHTTRSWNNGNTANYVTTGATSWIDGKANTATIITFDSDSGTAGTQPHQAAQYCADLALNGYDDWYLPATWELGVLFFNRALIGDFQAVTYLTSTEANTSSNYRIVFNIDDQTTDLKRWAANVRCVRRGT